MKKTLGSLCLTLALSPTSFAATNLSIGEITASIIDAVDYYASSIACNEIGVTPGNIAALTPLKSLELNDQEAAQYAVWWMGDIGCAGGTATTSAHIAIVKVGAASTFYVDPAKSSPVIDFDTPNGTITKLVGNTKNSLVFDGADYRDTDPRCCPSIATRFTLQVNHKGDWKLIDKKILPRKQ